MPTLRQAITQRLRRWLLGPQLQAEIDAAVQRLHALGQETDAAAGRATAEAAAQHADWHALPGLRIELRDTGFQIQMRVHGQSFAYVLITPEGADFFAHPDLETLKTLGQRMADQRSQFNPSPSGPRPYGLPRTH